MASITIRNLDEDLKRLLREQAEEHGRTLQEEVQDILRRGIRNKAYPRKIGTSIHRRFAAIGGFDLELPEREPMPDPPNFD